MALRAVDNMMTMMMMMMVMVMVMTMMMVMMIGGGQKTMTRALQVLSGGMIQSLHKVHQSYNLGKNVC